MPNMATSTVKYAQQATNNIATGNGEVTPKRVEFAPPEYSVNGKAHCQVGKARHLRDAPAVFGDYIHFYDMQQAKEDGATLAIYFETRVAKLKLKDEHLPLIDDEVDELAEDEEESVQSRLYSRWQRWKRWWAPSRVSPAWRKTW